MTNSPLVVCVFAAVGQNRARTVSYPEYLDEVLRHAGVFHQRIGLAQLEQSLSSASPIVSRILADSSAPSSCASPTR